MTAPVAPAALGRGLVIEAGSPVPPTWADTPVHVIGADPGDRLIAELHDAWSRRVPVVMALEVDPGVFRAAPGFDDEPWTLDPTFEIAADRLHFLLWANTYDGRRTDRDPVWWWAVKAARLGGEVGDDVDLVLGDGRRAWVDGGPRPAPALDGDDVVVHRESVELGELRVAPSPSDPADHLSEGLAPDQLAAVAHGAGPARIIAPAGSGKTRVLTARLRHLLVDRGFEPPSVLAVAYNKKAQLELESRIGDVRSRVRTLNSLGLNLVGRALGRTPTVLDEREVRRIVERLVPIPRRRANTDPLGPYVEALSLVRLGLRDPSVVEEQTDDVPGLADAFGPFRRTLAEMGAVDFDEQIYRAIEVLLADGEFRRMAQQSCRHLLVDEFQDLTPAHVLMLRLLAAPGFDVFGVGDDDQVIYGHAGADPRFLVHFAELFPGAADHPLEVNYRCPATVVDKAATLLGYNHTRVAKTIRPGPDADPDEAALKVIAHESAGGGAAIADTVRAWLDDGVEGRDIAVLARVNSVLLVPHVVLGEAGVPVASTMRSDILRRTGMRAALAYLRIADDPGRMAATDIVEILRRPTRGLPPWFSDRLGRRSWNLDRLAAIRSQVPENVAPKVDQLVADLSLVADAAPRGTGAVLDVVRDEVGLGQAMQLLDGNRAATGATHMDDLDALRQLADLHPDVATFESWLTDALEHTSNDDDGVTISTIHRVKGSEWDRVIVFGVSAGLVPHRLAENREEERRVLHVAMTRARREAVLLADGARRSRFLAELDGSAPKEPPPSQRAGRAATAAGGRRDGAAGTDGRTSGLPEPDEAVLGALRAWRSERSRTDGVPAYIVFNDRTMAAMARSCPRTERELATVPGIGPAKLENYGDELLALISEHTPSTDDRAGDN
ncbi:MAG: ATP-dependent DNA helicase UvrD2 [Actinomycetota bacterium]|nr:ATP-dependent DNA helicase UvrD2 [Actinomycetota bacterium]